MKSFLYTLMLLISTSVTTYGFRNPPDEIIDMGPAKPVTSIPVVWNQTRMPNTPIPERERLKREREMNQERINCNIIGGDYNETSLFEDKKYSFVPSLVKGGQIFDSFGHCSCPNTRNDPSITSFSDPSVTLDKVIVSFEFGLHKCDQELVELEFMLNYDRTPYISNKEECLEKGGTFKFTEGNIRERESATCHCTSGWLMRQNQSCTVTRYK